MVAGLPKSEDCLLDSSPASDTEAGVFLPNRKAFLNDKGKPGESQGRKATGLNPQGHDRRAAEWKPDTFQ
jgi:hypothetical protein